MPGFCIVGIGTGRSALHGPWQSTAESFVEEVCLGESPANCFRAGLVHRPWSIHPQRDRQAICRKSAQTLWPPLHVALRTQDLQSGQLLSRGLDTVRMPLPIAFHRPAALGSAPARWSKVGGSMSLRMTGEKKNASTNRSRSDGKRRWCVRTVSKAHPKTIGLR